MSSQAAAGGTWQAPCSLSHTLTHAHAHAHTHTLPHLCCCSSCTLGNSTVGPVPGVGLLQALVDIVLPLVTLIVNGDLAKGFPLPPIEGVAFTNTSGLVLMEGYAQLAANFTFTFPAM